MRRGWIFWFVALGFSGCLGTPPAAPPGEEKEEGVPGIEFGTPLALTGEIGGFEPSIRAGPEGNLYAAAAKVTRPNAGDRLADWAWYSTDQGASWAALPMGPGRLGALMAGVEGDLAVDARGRLYYADTHLVDDTLHRWSPGPGHVPSWDFSRPLVPTVDILDDRPFMSAHGDGVVYLMSNNGVAVPGPRNLLKDPTSLPDDAARIWIFSSIDAGLTWGPGWGFPGETFCAPSASPADDVTVTVACHRGAGAGAALTVYRSGDRAATFQTVWSTNFTNGPGYLTPWPATDAEGRTYAAWLDDRIDWSGLQDVAWAGAAAGRVMFARDLPGNSWQRLDVTPFAGRFGMGHLSAGPAGVVAITFHATTDLSPGNDTSWFGYALVTTDATADVPVWRLAPLMAEPTGVGPIPPRDFFQNAVGPDGRVHVALQRDRETHPSEDSPVRGIPADVLYVGQTRPDDRSLAKA